MELNIAEIEINMMDRECLVRKIGDAEKLENKISRWAKDGNEAKKKKDDLLQGNMRIPNYPNIMLRNC